MKITFTTALFPPEIAEPAPYSKRLSEELSRTHDLKVFTYANQIEKVAGTQIKVIKKNQHLLGRLFDFTHTLYKNSKDTELIYTHGSVAVSLPAIITSKLRNIPIVIRYSEDEPLMRSRLLKLTEQSLEEFVANPKTNSRTKIIKKLKGIILRRADYVITSSNLFSEITEKHYKVKKDKIIKIYNPAPKREILPFDDSIVPKQVCAFNNDDLPEIIRAIKNLNQEFPNIILYVIGKNKEQKEINKICYELNIRRKIKFFYSISKAEKDFIKRTSNILIANVKEEDKTDLIISSFENGTPIISTQNEMIRDQENGIIVEDFSHKILSEKISKLFRDENLSQRIMGNAKKDFVDKYTWENHLSKLEDIFLKYQK